MSVHASPARPGDDLVPRLQALLKDLPEGVWTGGGLAADLWDQALIGPALDVLSRTGKGFRGRLLEHSWVLGGGSPGQLPELLPLAIEVLHAGSLIIDDIEDDSRTRRGEPTLHRRVGLPLALNTGNWLYFLSLSLLSRIPVGPAQRLEFFEDVSSCLLQCHQGQALDLSVAVTSTPRATVPRVVETVTRLKTGALTGLASTLGARTANAPPHVVEAIAAFGTEVGVGLQMLDDWSGLHVEARRDKGLEDLRLGRPTWPWAWLAQGKNELAYADLAHKVRDSVTDWEFDQARKLMVSRLGALPVESIEGRFARAVSTLRQEIDGAVDLEPVERELEALVEAYV
jgi:geranylgeranyl pyrophosphate synthase